VGLGPIQRSVHSHPSQRVPDVPCSIHRPPAGTSVGGAGAMKESFAGYPNSQLGTSPFGTYALPHHRLFRPPCVPSEVHPASPDPPRKRTGILRGPPTQPAFRERPTGIPPDRTFPHALPPTQRLSASQRFPTQPRVPVSIAVPQGLDGLPGLGPRRRSPLGDGHLKSPPFSRGGWPEGLTGAPPPRREREIAHPLALFPSVHFTFFQIKRIHDYASSSPLAPTEPF